MDLARGSSFPCCPHIYSADAFISVTEHFQLALISHPAEEAELACVLFIYMVRWYVWEWSSQLITSKF